MGSEMCIRDRNVHGEVKGLYLLSRRIELLSSLKVLFICNYVISSIFNVSIEVCDTFEHAVMPSRYVILT